VVLDAKFVDVICTPFLNNSNILVPAAIFAAHDTIALAKYNPENGITKFVAGNAATKLDVSKSVVSKDTVVVALLGAA